MISKEKILQIKAIILDIDGVLTDGRIGYSETENEIKFFDVKDGLGIKLALKAGFYVGILSGRSSKANSIRINELGLSFAYQGEKHKEDGLDKLTKEHGILPNECMFIGDDIIDIPVMKKVGIAVAVNDAVNELDKYSHFRTSCKGGRGAVREAIEWLLKETGKWENILQRYQ